MATELVRYDAARRALAAAKSIDEVRKIRGSAAALRAYAKQAKNRTLEIDAAEIRIRAERRVGELIDAQRQTVGLNRGAKGPKISGAKHAPLKDDRPTLADAGIDKHLAKRARELAAIPAPKFESLVTGWRDTATTGKDRITNQLVRTHAREEVRQAPTTTEIQQRIADLAHVEDRIAEGRRHREQHPEQYAADEVFSMLTASMDHCDKWIPALLQNDSPGRQTAADWAALIERMRRVMQTLLVRWEGSRQ